SRLRDRQNRSAIAIDGQANGCTKLQQLDNMSFLQQQPMGSHSLNQPNLTAAYLLQKGRGIPKPSPEWRFNLLSRARLTRTAQ
ncbi:hypothetical protein NW819_07155, partial [Synechococcus sp. R8-2]|uniref:hypothetical protein n=1 Tax=Synechococcus sp. R8-2 TaxID=2291959 RepID=UPI0039C1D8FE